MAIAASGLDAETVELNSSEFSRELQATPSRTFIQPASVETALPARASSPQRYMAPVTGVTLPTSPVRQLLGTPPMPLSPTVAALPALPAMTMTTVAPSAASSATLLEPQERVQVPRVYGRSPDMVLRDMGLTSGRAVPSTSVFLPQTSAVTGPVELPRARSPAPEQRGPLALASATSVPVPQVTVVEKVMEPSSMSYQDMEVWLQGERSRLTAGMQEIITQQSKALTEVINDEVHKVIHMVNAVSNSCEERLVRLEADRSARSTAFQGLKRDFDGLQAQIADLEQFRTLGSTVKDQAGKEREEVMAILDAVTKDIRNQHRSVLAGLTTQKEMQQRLEASMTDIRGNVDTLSAEVRHHRSQFATVSSQQDLLVLQQDQQKIDQALVDLRRQTQQSLDVVRSEFANEVMMLRQTQFGALLERVQSLETSKNEMQDLQRLVQAERTARGDLVQTFDAFRAQHLQTVSEMRLELESWPERQARLEERSARDRSVTLEQALNELRTALNRRFSDMEVKVEATTWAAKDAQELKRLLTVEQSDRLEQVQALEAHRKAHLQELERLNERLIRVTSDPSEDRAARERCVQIEKSHQDIRNVLTRELQKCTSRFETMEGNFKDLEEMTRALRAESSARTDLSQTIDAYRVAHLRTSAELRADLDLALEKLSRLESSSMQDVGRQALAVERMSLNGTAGFAASAVGAEPSSPLRPSSLRSAKIGQSFVQASTTVRWNASWNELMPDEQKFAGILGWTQDRWDNSLYPPSSSKSWSQLTPQEQDAAARFGWTFQSWDRLDEYRLLSPGMKPLTDSPNGPPSPSTRSRVTNEESASYTIGGSFAGRRMQQDVAEVLADDRRFGRGLRAGGRR